MSHENFQPDPGTLPGPNAPAPDERARAATPGSEQANKGRAADLDRLAQLQKEYVDLRDQASRAPAVQRDPRQDALARKGEVTREMDEIKRKHGLA